MTFVEDILFMLFVCFRLNQCLGDCGVNFTSYVGTFHSPRYPLFYKNNLDCTWRITVPDGYMIKLVLWDIHTESSLTTCRSDYLSLVDSDMSEIWRRCDRGISEPVTHYSRGEELTLILHSDGITRGRGFNASFYAIQTIYKCDFESANQCDFSDSGNDFSWTITRGSDDSYFTGPTTDHTYGNSTGAFAMAKTKRGNPKKFKSFSLVLPQYELYMPSSSVTFQFSYHMWYVGFGSASGSLQIYVCDQVTFSREGDHKNVWHTDTIDIGNDIGNCSINVTAVTANIDVAIDDITIYEVIHEEIPEESVTFVTDVLLTDEPEGGDDIILVGDSPSDDNSPEEPPGNTIVVLTTEDIAFIAITSVAIILIFLIAVLIYVLIKLKRKEKRIKAPLAERATFANEAYSSILDDYMSANHEVANDVALEPPTRWERIEELSNGKIDEMLVVYNVSYQNVDKYHDNGIKKIAREKRKKSKSKVVNFQTIKEENETEINGSQRKGKR